MDPITEPWARTFLSAIKNIPAIATLWHSIGALALASYADATDVDRIKWPTEQSREVADILHSMADRLEGKSADHATP